MLKSVHRHSLRWWHRLYSAKPRADVGSFNEVEVFVEGAEVEGFLVIKVAALSEFNITMVRLRHVRSGCDYLHLARKNDNNNVFSACFRTTPTNSSGVSRVLERVVLCGSQKYPCRNPFFRMTGRSLASYMNVLRGPDHTLYPFATFNKSDFKNLLSVYLDAVFRPQLKEIDFLHEGWRYEHETADRESPIIIKGAVYNEARSAVCDSNTVFSNTLLNNLMPSHTYGVVSGGSPKDIPKLTYADLNDFHKKYYHPSNCRMYSYGNLPLLETLKFINKEYLEDCDTADYAKVTKVPSEPRWDVERRKHVSFRPHPSGPKTQSTIAIATLCNDARASQDSFNMRVVSDLLVSGTSPPFYRTLMEKNIGSGFAPATGLGNRTRDCFFSVGLTGMDPNDFEKVVDIYHDTVKKVVDFGFEEGKVNAVLHSLELLARHQSANFGLDLLINIVPVWIHDGDVSQALKTNDLVAKFRKSLEDNPLFIQELVNERLKTNNHRLILTMSPDESLEAEDKVSAIGVLSPSVREAIWEQSASTQEEREIKQDARCLPAVAISDIAPDVERAPLRGYTVQNVPVQVCAVPTNGVTYVRGVLNAAILSAEAKSLLPLFCLAVTKMGTGSNSYKKLDELIHLKTGRFSFGTHIAENIYDTSSFEEGLVFSSMCLDKNVKSMMELWGDVFKVDFTDAARFRSIVKNASRHCSQGLLESGDLFAVSAAAAQLSPPSARKETFGGIQFFQTIRELSCKVNLTEVQETMQGIAQVVLNKRLIRMAVNMGPENEEESLAGIDRFLKNIPGEFNKSFDITKPPKYDKPVNVSLHYEIPLSVNFTAHCWRTVPYTHVDFPILRLAARLLLVSYLPTIRGTSCNASISTSGTMSLSSFRDPNPATTFDAFKAAKSWLGSGEYASHDVEEAKLGVLQSMDSPISVGSKGIRNFLFGISDDELQRHRKAVMDAKKEDLMRVAEELNVDYQARCLIGPANPEITSREDENWQKRFLFL